MENLSHAVKKALSCWQLYILLIPALIWLIVFAYYPMYGLIIAFKDFKGRMGIMGSPWADPIFKYFKMFFSTSIAMTAIKNTIVISLESLIIGFPIPVIAALRLLDAPGGINIMTIHGFCQSLLKRFPLEAGVSPQFDVLANSTCA